MNAHRPRARRASTRARRSGFTLIELMVALTVGGIVIGSMYAIGSSSSRNFQIQHQIANMQSSLRFAYVQVKRDFLRAGYHATPRADLDECAPSGISASIDAGGTGWIGAISSFRNNVQPNIVDPTNGTLDLNTVARGFSHDQITLLGNYSTSNEYPGLQVINNTSVQLNTLATNTWHSIQTDFGWDPLTQVATTVINPNLVAAMFPAGSMIRIQTTTGRRHYATLVGAGALGANAITLNFLPPLPADCMGEAQGGWVAPLTFVRYAVAPSAANGLDTDRASGASYAQLLRTEVQPANKVAPLGPARVVLDYVATFNIAFTMSALVPIGQPDNYTIGQTNEVLFPANPLLAQQTVNTNPQLVRAVTLELGVRAPAVDPGMRWPCVTNFQTCMALAPNTVNGSAAARVRVLRSEIFLPNIAAEGY